MKNKILAALIAILAFGQGAMAASTFTVSNPTGSTFRITRTGNTAVSETIDWRVVSLSAIAGVHFTGVGGQYSGTVTFDPDDTYKDVTISESNPGDNAYKYQNGTDRRYRFEVLDRNGDILASCDRSRDYGTSVPSSGAFNIKDVTIYSSEYTADDDGYDVNGYKSVSSSAYFTSGNAPKAYLQQISAQLRMTLSFQGKENDDAYEYLQLLFDNTSTCDNRSDCSNGDPGNISLSTYMAGFEMNTGAKDDTYRDYTFPVTSVGNNAGAENPWGYGTKWPLSKQKFNSSRASDGRIIVPMNFSSIVLRLNASGSSGSDEWAVKNVTAHIQAVDPTAPTVLNNYKVSGVRHQKGNVIYVSVAFSEIVTVTGTPTLATSWGTLSYCAGSGSNVLTFKGEISSDATGTFSVTGHSGTIKDLAGNALSGTVSHDFGTALDADYAWTEADFNSLGTNTYEIATKTDLRHLALLVNAAKNPCTGLTFQQTQDITCDATYIPIGYYVSSSDRALFCGTYDGQGYTISGINVSRTGSTNADGYVGLFGYLSGATVKNVILASSTFTGYDNVGGIVGYNWGGTVENCRVESTVTINAGYNNAYDHGGIVGSNYSGNAKVIGCYSAATISQNGKSDCKQYGGIVGYNFGGTVKDCLYAGTTVTAANKKGAIVGYSEGSDATLTNNYYTAINLGGVGADGSSSDQDGARRARTVTLGTGVALSGTQTAYDASGLTAVGTTALQSGETIYSGATQTLTLAYGGSVSEGYSVTYTATAGTIDGSTLTMADADTEVSASVAAIPWSGSGGSAEDPYIILYPSQLDLLATNVNAGTDYSGKFFKLGNDIAYSSTTAWDNTENSNTENNFTAIGGPSGTTYNYFRGTFDGDGHTVSGIRITQKTKDSQGLFGYIGTSGTVKNITLSNARILSNKNGVGGIAGRNSGTITNCHVTADVNILGNGDYHGGIAGNNIGNITGCTSAAALNWRGNYRGGIAGQNSDATVSDCLVTGVSYSFGSNIFLGAIVGRNFDGTLTNNFYHDCSVNGATTNIGVGTDTEGVSNDADGAWAAAAYNFKPAEIGAQTATYPGGITVYEHGLAYQGVYYLASGTVVTASFALVQGTKDGVTAYWGTFYDGTHRYTLPAGAAAYTMDSEYKLYRLGTDGRTIPAGVAVVIIAASADVTLTLDGGSSAITDHAPGGNILHGSDSAVTVSGLSGTPYVLGKVGDVLGFYQYTGTDLPAGKAYYVVTP